MAFTTGNPYYLNYEGIYIMNIVHYIRAVRLEDGGVVRAVLDLCEALARRGHEVTLLTFDLADIPQKWNQGNAQYPRAMKLQKGILPWSAVSTRERDIASIVSSANALHLHVIWDLVGLQLAHQAKRAATPYFVTLHGMLDDWSLAQKHTKKVLHLRLAGRRFLENAAAVHVTADGEKAQSEKWFPRGNSHVIPCLFDLGPYNTLPGPAPARAAFASDFPEADVPIILFLSRLHQKKGLELLICAADILRGDGLQFRILIAGSGEDAYEEHLKTMVSSHGLSEHIRFLGFVSGIVKVSLYEAADLFVLPTSQENWGFVLMESLLCGTPVMTTRGVDIWSELESSQAALIVEQDAEQIAAAIGAFFRDTTKRESMNRCAKTWALATLSPETISARYEDMYAEVQVSSSSHR